MRLLLLLSLSLNACSTIPTRIPRSPLVKQILRFRMNEKNPSNRACVAWDEKNSCTKEDNTEYDLRVVEVRKLLNDLSFICNVAGKRYKIDPGTPQLRRDTIEKCGFLKLKKCRRSQFIDVEKVDFLRQANTKCFSSKTYKFDTFK